jgi:hypothetical protein
MALRAWRRAFPAMLLAGCSAAGASSVGDAGEDADGSIGSMDGAVPPMDGSDLDTTAASDSSRDAGGDTGQVGDAAPTCNAPGSFGSTHGEAFTYGRHYPNGVAAVAYLYGPDGTWGDLTGLAYGYNYYAACGTSDHPTNLNALVAAANGPPFTTRDANCHLLWAADPAAADPQLGVPEGGAGHAFHEHSGVGAGGVKTGAPFTVYWYDDNTLALSMSTAYGQPTADGLVTFSDFTRWAVIAGNAAAWHGMPYGSPGNPTGDCCVDTMALNGLYDLAMNDFASAASEWKSILASSGATYDGATQRCLYPSIASNYYLGLFKILTDQMMGDPAAASSSDPTASVLLQHSISLDSDILDTQQQESDGGLIGWTTNIPPGTSLINTETVACQVLGLGARANSVFEPGVAPLSNDPNHYFLRPYHALSAVGSAGSTPGYMTRGPGFAAPAGTYAIDFRLRAPSPTGTVATLSVYDSASKTVLATHDVAAGEMTPGNLWTQITLTATVPSGCHTLELRTNWSGTGNLDVGPIRVR